MRQSSEVLKHTHTYLFLHSPLAKMYVTSTGGIIQVGWYRKPLLFFLLCICVCVPTVQGCGVRLRKLRFSTHTYTQTQTQFPRGFSLFLRTTIILISSAKSNTVFPLEVRKFRKILVGGFADVRKREALRERYFAPIPLNGDRLPYKKSRCAQRTPQRNCTTRPFAKD